MSDRDPVSSGRPHGQLRRALLTAAMLVLIVVVVRLGVGAVDPPVVGLVDGGLAPCPPTDNCVRSRAEDPRHAVEPLRCSGDLSQVIEVAEAALPRVQLVEHDGDHAHLEARSRVVGFIDDLEFHAVGSIVHVRSASRLGNSDLGVNRERVESLRGELERAGVCG